jgi:hypothetical protein
MAAKTQQLSDSVPGKGRGRLMSLFGIHNKPTKTEIQNILKHHEPLY